MEKDKFDQALLIRADLANLGIKLSNTQLLRLERDNRFPRRIYLTPARVVWYRREIDAWIQSRADERSRRTYSDY
jgi:predicted DNA-binding transcriptional regulator AlpA